MSKVEQLKIELYDLIERQALVELQYKQLNEAKMKKHAQLQVALKEEMESALAAGPAAKPVKPRADRKKEAEKTSV